MNILQTLIEIARALKVLIINDFSNLVGGAERFLENLLQEPSTEPITYYQMAIADLFPVRQRMPNRLTASYKRIRIWKEIVKAMREKIGAIQPDVIHLNNNNLYTNSVAKSLKDMTIPIVYFLHDDYSLKRLQSLFFPQFKTNFLFATHSPDIYHQLLSTGRKAFLVKVPFNHYNWHGYPPKDGPGKKIDLLYVGRLEKGKGIFKLIEAVEKIKEVIPTISLSILGEGSQMQSILNSIKTKNLTPNIHLAGFQRDDQLRQHYYNARILVFPSEDESLGYVGLEAQSCGLPVITFDHQGARRWCRDYHNGFLVEGRSAQKLADKVLEIINDDVLLTRISINAREQMEFESYNASRQELTDIFIALCPL